MAKQPLLVINKEEQTTHVRKRLPVVNSGLKVLNPTGKDVDDYQDDFLTRKRRPYSRMQAHMEMAATAFAAGATVSMAAKYAGISRRQVRKYITDADFRYRVEELRALMMSKVRGKIIREIDRRTAPELIQKMEVLDLLRIGDRVGLGRGQVEAEAVDGEKSNYDHLLQQIFVINGESESADFPVYGPESLPIPGSDSSVDR